MRRRDVIAVLEDAILDRFAYIEACAGVDWMAEDVFRTRETVAGYQTLLARYRGSARVSLTESDRTLLRRACGEARSWNQALLDAVVGKGSKDDVALPKKRLVAVRRVLEYTGGELPDPLRDAVSVNIMDLLKPKEKG